MAEVIRPAEICRHLLAALDASEGRRRRRKRDTTPDAIGMAIKRRLLEETVQDDPDPDVFEGWLLHRCLSADDSRGGYAISGVAAPSGSVRAMALDVLAEWRLAQTSETFRSWLDQGARSDDVSGPVSAVTSSGGRQSHPPPGNAIVKTSRRRIVAVKKKKSARWSGAKKSGSAAAGKAKAQSDRNLQEEAERRRRRTEAAGSKKKEGAVQTGQRRYPEPPLPKQHLAKPGLESELEPRPKFLAPAYRGSGKLEGKVAIITGGDSGIGRAVAVLFAREGADVAIVYLSEDEDAEETRLAVEGEGRRAILIPGDVTDSRFCDQAVETAVRELGRLDILVNNAAFQEHLPSLEDLSDEQLDRTFRTNIYGYFYMARAALKHLKRGGAIVNSGSVVGIQGSKELLDYASTKGAIHAFTKSLAQNLVDRGIRVNAVAPGPVWTPLNPADQDAEQVAEFGADVPMKRPAQPEEIAPSYVFLAAPVCSSYITGEVLPVLGGETVA